jgi:hypothetical protein
MRATTVLCSVCAAPILPQISVEVYGAYSFAYNLSERNWFTQKKTRVEAVCSLKRESEYTSSKFYKRGKEKCPAKTK